MKDTFVVNKIGELEAIPKRLARIEIIGHQKKKEALHVTILMKLSLCC